MNMPKTFKKKRIPVPLSIPQRHTTQRQFIRVHPMAMFGLSLFTLFTLFMGVWLGCVITSSQVFQQCAETGSWNWHDRVGLILEQKPITCKYNGQAPVKVSP